jgi:hypothetical protein
MIADVPDKMVIVEQPSRRGFSKEELKQLLVPGNEIPEMMLSTFLGLLARSVIAKAGKIVGPSRVGIIPQDASKIIYAHLSKGVTDEELWTNVRCEGRLGSFRAMVRF